MVAETGAGEEPNNMRLCSCSCLLTLKPGWIKRLCYGALGAGDGGIKPCGLQTLLFLPAASSLFRGIRVNVSKALIRISFYMCPVHAAAFSLPPFWGNPEARGRHISWSPVMRVRPWSIQGLHRNRAELLKICMVRAEPLTYVSVGKPDVMASILPNITLVFPWSRGFWL